MGSARPDDRSGSSDPRKALSQNFLRPGNVVSKFVSQAAIGDEDVVEIGGGEGVITRELARTGARVTVIERDPRYASHLRELFDGSSAVSVVQADVRDFRWPTGEFRAVGNLPFSITTDILRVLLEWSGAGLMRADLITQSDVARKRAGAPEGNKLNLVWAPWWDLSLGPIISASSFSPRPRVDAAVLIAKRRSDPLLPPEERELWTGVIEAAFERGGEPLRRSLSGILTATQLRRASAGRWEPNGLTSRVPIAAWLDIYVAVRDHVPRDRWPKARVARAPARATKPAHTNRRKPRRRK